MKAVFTIVALLAGISGQMYGTVLVPGAAPVAVSSSTLQSVVTGPTSNNFVDQNSQDYTICPSTGTCGSSAILANGVLYQAIYEDQTNPNLLDFYFEFTSCGGATKALNGGVAPALACSTNPAVASKQTVSSIQLVNYAGITVNASYITGTDAAFSSQNLTSSASLAPTSVEQSSNVGNPPVSTVTFDFGTGLTAGKDSAVLVLQTNANANDSQGTADFFSVKGVTTSSGGTTNIFEPLLITPEPTFYGLMAFGLVGLLFSARRYSRKRAAHTA